MLLFVNVWKKAVSSTSNDKVSFAEFVEIYSSVVLSGNPEFKINAAGLYTPAKHIEVCNWVQNNRSGIRLLMAHRHFGKSFLVTLYPVWRLYLDANYTCAIVSATSKIPARNASAIRTIIETHPLTKHLVPDGNSSFWQRTAFTVNRPVPSMEASVTCTSVGGSKTGLHPVEVICDDIETQENCRTEEARERIQDAFYEVMNLSNDILMIGTPHDEKTIYTEIEDMGSIVKKIPVYGYDELGVPYDSVADGGVIQLPELRDEKWFEQKRKANKTSVWESQYKLIPKAAYDVVMDPDMIRRYEGPIVVDESWFRPRNPLKPFVTPMKINGEDIRDLKAFWDPATGARNRDASVISVCASTEEGNVYIVALEALPAVSKDTAFDKQMQRVLDICSACHVNKIFVEVNFVRTLATELRRFAKAQKKKVSIQESVRSQNKRDFIGDNIEPLIKVGRLYCTERILIDSDLKKEMRDFPTGKHDDHIDAVAGCIAELKIPGIQFKDEKGLTDKPLRYAPVPVVVN